MTILLAAGDCFAAFLLAPVAAALRARGAALRIAGAAVAGELPALRTLLGPGAAVRAVADDAAADAFAGELVATGPATIVVVGRSPFGHALSRCRGSRRLVQIDGGVRAHGVAAVDPVADAHAVAGEAERCALLQDGVPSAAVHVVGDLVATALAMAGLPAPGAGARLVVACEHANTLPAAWATVLAAGNTELPALAADTTARPDLATVATARVLVTDSVGWQRVAAARGVPCIVTPGAGLWAPAVAAGLATMPTADGDAFVAALRQLAPAASPPAPGGVAERIADLVLAPAAATTALPSDGDASGRTFGDDEAALVTLVLQRGTLNSTRGTMVATFEQRFARWLGRKHAIACASGSAAVHCAIAALQLQPGDEVITTPITDMGALTPILYEGAVPVFADVDARTLDVTAATIEAQLTERTRAIVVTHLFGLPADLDAIGALAAARGIPLIEDAAQAFGATWRGRKIGTFGTLAAFSLQQGKHITAGEGGIVATDDDALARRVFLYVNKAWGYGDKQPDHYFPALNYRLTELQGAVLVAQLPKLDGVVAARRGVAAALRLALAGVPGLQLPTDPAHGTHAYWKFAFFVDPAVVPGGAVALGKRMQQLGIACVPRYIQKPAFECALFADWRRSPVTWLPLQHNPRRERAAAMFDRAAFPGAVDGLEHVVVLPINERYRDTDVAHVAARIRTAIGDLQRG